VIKSYVVGYSDTSTAYKSYIPTQWKTIVTRDVKFNEDVRSSSNSRDCPSEIEENEEVVVPYANLKTRDESNSRIDEARLGMDMPSPSTPPYKKSGWLTQTLHEA